MIYNLTKKSIIARHALQPLGLYARGRGMIGRSFSNFDAMVFENCDAIHTFFMSSSIDVIFIDVENKVLKALPELKPWRLLVHCPNARTVIELPPGAIQKSMTEPGDFVDLMAEATPEALDEIKKSGGKFMTEAGAIVPLEETK